MTIRCKNFIYPALFALFLFFFNIDSVLAQEKATYQVKPGDTLYSISKQLEVTIAELKQWNSLQGNEIEPGQSLTYYNRESTSTNTTGNLEGDSDPLISNESASRNAYYTVKSGDNLYKISREHNMSLEELKELNNLSSDQIRVGQKLAVKQVNVAPSVARFAEESTPQGVFAIYDVKSGESLPGILSRFKMTEEELLALNPALNLQSIDRGQKITVLMPPSRNYDNPYLQKANLQDLGEVNVTSYSASETGQPTTTGDLYDPESLTAAHSNISLGSIIFVENNATGNGVYVRINDRITGSGLKLSQKAFEVLELNSSTQPTVTIYTED
ncbi:LysM peptidoglycan-binding domain-containing protein [Gracilimonas mengyeensis]|nr:LysM peptidoglycan-binding domain-containing protein [Gracilimonas mengyeensis]